MKILVNNEVQEMTAEQEASLRKMPDQQDISAEEALEIIMGGDSV